MATLHEKQSLGWLPSSAKMYPSEVKTIMWQLSRGTWYFAVKSEAPKYSFQINLSYIFLKQEPRRKWVPSWGVLCSEVGRLAPNLVQYSVRLSRHLLHKKVTFPKGTERNKCVPKKTYHKNIRLICVRSWGEPLFQVNWGMLKPCIYSGETEKSIFRRCL